MKSRTFVDTVVIEAAAGIVNSSGASDALSYLAELKVSDGEFLKFKINITPQGEEGPARLQFSKRFFTY